MKRPRFTIQDIRPAPLRWLTISALLPLVIVVLVAVSLYEGIKDAWPSLTAPFSTYFSMWFRSLPEVWAGQNKPPITKREQAERLLNRKVSQ